MTKKYHRNKKATCEGGFLGLGLKVTPYTRPIAPKLLMNGPAIRGSEIMALKSPVLNFSLPLEKARPSPDRQNSFQNNFTKF